MHLAIRGNSYLAPCFSLDTHASTEGSRQVGVTVPQLLYYLSTILKHEGVQICLTAALLWYCTTVQISLLIVMDIS